MISFEEPEHTETWLRQAEGTCATNLRSRSDPGHCFQGEEQCDNQLRTSDGVSVLGLLSQSITNWELKNTGVSMVGSCVRF